MHSHSIKIALSISESLEPQFDNQWKLQKIYVQYILYNSFLFLQLIPFSYLCIHMPIPIINHML